MPGLMLALLIALAVAGLIAHRRQARRIDALAAEVRSLRAIMAATSPPATQVAAERVLPPAPIAEPAHHVPPVTAPVPEMAEPAAPRRQAAPPRPPREPLAARLAGVGFEQIVGGRLPIWVGGAALAIAGFYLVALAIDAGLLAPPVRVGLALLFGVGLIAASEGAGRWRIVAEDERVAQALAGAGIASLYAAAYLGSAIYGLIGAVPAFVLTVLVTAAALVLALRRGPPTAIMGLIGGFAAPLLATGGDAVVPLLAYLGLLSAGLFALAIRRNWMWLAVATSGGSFLWLLALIADGASLAAGLFVLAFAAASALALPASATAASPARAALLRGAPVALGLVELAGLIPASGFGIEGWGLYLALSAGAIVLAWRDARLTGLVAGALGLSLAALASATGAGGPQHAIPGAIGIALLFGGAGHALGRRAGDGWGWAAIGGVALLAPFALMRLDRGALLADGGWGLLALLLALAPLHLAWRSRGAGRAVAPFDRTLQIATATASLLAAAATADLLPETIVPLALAAIALALAEAGRRTGDGGLAVQSAMAAGVAWLAMAALAPGTIAALARSLGGAHVLLPDLPAPGVAVRVLLLPASVLAAAAWRCGGERARRAIATAAATGAIAGLYVLAKRPLAIGSEAAFVARGFLERAILTQALLAAGAVVAARSAVVGRGLVLLGLARILWFDLLLLNPAFVAQSVGAWPIANLLALHFGLAVAWLALAWRREEGAARNGMLAALVAVALGGALLLVRQLFHGDVPAYGAVSRAEFYGYSVAALAVALALLGWGARGGDRTMRIAGLGLLTLVSLKVFLVDAAALQGILRALSFLGLGLALIGIGWAYGRFLGRANPAPPPFSG
ncbi:DUF2339 domain-containing protein [Sphingomonas profundi]|uniref:DUF2339 domain-containing protein n=1 Tax=Alterirhizorhabdus profundi TaxID=2681549 RepID=UPI0012E747EB|nr:DUF2339 domain-containing protein [Sphingomonas profundi]